MTRAYSAALTASAGATTVDMALLTQAAIGPSSASTRSAAASTPVASATSTGIASTAPPWRRSMAAASSSRAGSRARMATDQPSRAS